MRHDRSDSRIVVSGHTPCHTPPSAQPHRSSQGPPSQASALPKTLTRLSTLETRFLNSWKRVAMPTPSSEHILCAFMQNPLENVRTSIRARDVSMQSGRFRPGGPATAAAAASTRQAKTTHLAWLPWWASRAFWPSRQRAASVCSLSEEPPPVSGLCYDAIVRPAWLPQSPH